MRVVLDSELFKTPTEVSKKSNQKIRRAKSFRYIARKDKSADTATRGTEVENLNSQDLRWNGLSWPNEEEKWLKWTYHYAGDEMAGDEEIRNIVDTVVNQICETFLSIIETGRFSKWSRLRTVIWPLPFIRRTTKGRLK